MNERHEELRTEIQGLVLCVAFARWASDWKQGLREISRREVSRRPDFCCCGGCWGGFSPHCRKQVFSGFGLNEEIDHEDKSSFRPGIFLRS